MITLCIRLGCERISPLRWLIRRRRDAATWKNTDSPAWKGHARSGGPCAAECRTGADGPLQWSFPQGSPTSVEIVAKMELLASYGLSGWPLTTRMPTRQSFGWPSPQERHDHQPAQQLLPATSATFSSCLKLTRMNEEDGFSPKPGFGARGDNGRFVGGGVAGEMPESIRGLASSISTPTKRRRHCFKQDGKPLLYTYSTKRAACKTCLIAPRKTPTPSDHGAPRRLQTTGPGSTKAAKPTTNRSRLHAFVPEQISQARRPSDITSAKYPRF